MTLDPMRSTSPTMEEGDLKSGFSGKTNYLRPQMAKASVQVHEVTRFLIDY